MKKNSLTFVLAASLLLTPSFLAGCNNPSGSVERVRDNVTNYDLGNGNKYTGTMYDGKMDGEGKIKFSNSDELTGTFVDGELDSTKECTFKDYSEGTTFTGYGRLNSDFSFDYIEGKLELGAKRSYTGKFKNNLYEDDNATFDFGTNTKYVGPFKEGSNVGLVGTIYYPPYYLQGEGVWYFKGEMASLGKFVLNQTGKGKIKFGDWSTYEGDIFHDTDNGWWRKGYGVQDFSKCTYNASIVGGPSNLLMDRYIGYFDYTVTLWIHGNGTMYFMDEDGNPAGYINGFYNALKRAGKETTEIEIIDEYKGTPEFDYDPENLRSSQYQEKYKNSTPDIVFCGDSYMDMWQVSYGLANYERDTASLNCINTGIGGTVGSEWAILQEKLVTAFTPKQVFIHLGFNDTHMGFSTEQIIESFSSIRNSIVSNNPSVEIYFLGIEPSPAFSSYFEIEQVNNAAIKQFCDTTDNANFIDTQNLFIEDGKAVSDLASYFSTDYVHLNSKGYEVWYNKIKEYIK